MLKLVVENYYREVHPLSLYDVLLTALLVVSVLLIIVVLMQPSKTNAASTLTGGAEQLFGKQKARGFEAVLRQITVVLGALFILIALALTYLSSN